MIQLMQISSGHGAPTTYMALSGVLAFLVFMTIWRDAISSGFGSFFSRTFAAIAFLGSRIVAIIFSGSLVSASVAPPALYMILNFICLYLAAGDIPAVSKRYARISKYAKDDSLEISEKQRDLRWRTRKRTLNIQALVLALIAAAVYLLSPKPGVNTLNGITAAMLFGATVRVLAYLMQSTARNVSDMGILMRALFIFLTSSWLAVIFASFTEGTTASFFLHLSRGADVFALITGLVAIQSNFLILGFYHKNRAEDRKSVV